MKKSTAKDSFTRRRFMHFLGYTSTAYPLAKLGGGLVGAALLPSCATSSKSDSSLETETSKDAKLPFQPLGAVSEDKLSLVEGMEFRVLAKWNDVINSRGQKFGINNDFNAFIPHEGLDEGYLCVNHEYPSPVLQYPLSAESYKIAQQWKRPKNKFASSSSQLESRS